MKTYVVTYLYWKHFYASLIFFLDLTERAIIVSFFHTTRHSLHYHYDVNSFSKYFLETVEFCYVS